MNVALGRAGGVATLLFENGKGNILTSALMEQLSARVREVAEDPSIHAVVLAGQGPDFSFGASVEEHQPDQVGTMLPRFHRALLDLMQLSAPVVAAVRGRCLGGGLELALACSRIVASHDVTLGQPEVKLGVIAPAGSALLPGRVGQAAAEDLLITGRTVRADEAHALGLVDEVSADPLQRATGYARQFETGSRSALAFAVRAAREEYARRVEARLLALERLYLDELARTPDAVEGIAAFVQKRPPAWARTPEHKP